MFGAKKAPKSQRPDSSPLYIYHLHETTPALEKIWTQEYRQIVTIDIGYQNLCRRIARRYFDPLSTEALVYDKASIPMDVDEDGLRIMFNGIKMWLEEYRDEYMESHVIIIEWQLPINYIAVRISTYILAYFDLLLSNSPLCPILLEMRSQFKDEYFPELKPLKDHARKTRCSELGKELLTIMGDEWSLEIFSAGMTKKKKKKQDDFADTVLMEEVFCRYATELGLKFPHYQGIEETPKRKVVVTRVNKEEACPPKRQITIVRSNI